MYHHNNMKKTCLVLCLFLFNFILFSNEKEMLFNYYNRHYNFNIDQAFNNNDSEFCFNFIADKGDSSDKQEKKEKAKIFDEPDYSWIKEEGRMEKIFIAAGTISIVIGFGLFLAGLINLLIPFDAVSSGGQPITALRNAYISLIGIGGGLMATGIPFIIVGVVRLGKNKTKKSDDTTIQ